MGTLSSSCSREGERWGPRRPPALAASTPETQVPGAQPATKELRCLKELTA